MARDIDFLISYDTESIKTELRRIAKLLGKQTVTSRDIDEHGRICSQTVANKFGSLHHAHKAAGLVPGFTPSSNEELLKIVTDLWTITSKKFGRSPMMLEVRKYGFPVGASTIARRFGSWNKALLAASKLAPGPSKRKKEEPAKVKREGKVKPKRSMISVRKRFLVFRRDGYTCRICKRGGGELHVDHVIPFCRGGSDSMDNLQTLCRDCNVGKGGNLE